MLRALVLSLPLSLGAAFAEAATFDVLRAGTDTLLGRFSAPAGGGPLISARFEVGGGTFSILGIGAFTPSYDAADNSLAGPGGVGFGGVFNAAAYATTDVDGDAVTCRIGDCVFEFDGIFDAATPGEWAVQYAPSDDPAAGANLAGGYYEIAAVPLPLPASALGLSLVGLALLRRGRTAAHLEGAVRRG